MGPSSTGEIAGLHIEVTPVDPDDVEELQMTLESKMVRDSGGGDLRGGRNH